MNIFYSRDTKLNKNVLYSSNINNGANKMILDIAILPAAVQFAIKNGEPIEFMEQFKFY